MIQKIAHQLKLWNIEYTIFSWGIETDTLCIYCLNTSNFEHIRSLCNPLRSIYLWEDIFFSREVQVLSRLASLLGKNKRIHARATKVIPLTQTEADIFLEQNHIMGSTKAKYKFGLTNNEQLVSVATFGNMVTFNDGTERKSSELIRFASLQHHTVVGGLDKLLKHFCKQQPINHLMTYVDQEWSDGKSLLNLGFTIQELCPAKTFWLD